MLNSFVLFIVVLLYGTEYEVVCQDQATIPEEDQIAPRVHQILILPPIPVQRVIGRDKLYLTCMASGNPVPVIQWSKDGILFQPNQPTYNAPGGSYRHIVTGNTLTLTEVNGQQDSGRYRCIATNSVGSVFLEKIINVRVMGEFFPPGRYQDPAIKLNPTIGRNYIIKCPSYVTGYGTKIKWGTVAEGTQIPSYFVAGRPHKRGFPMSGDRFAFSYVTRDDLIFSKNVGGVRCIMVNYGFIVASAQMLLWQAYKIVKEVRKPILIQHMPEAMEALVDTTFTMTCGATGFPQPRYEWQYQGIGLKSRWLNGSRELNFEFFRIVQAGHALQVTRVTKYSGGTYRCYAINSLGLTKKTGQLTVLFPPVMSRFFDDSYDISLESEWTFNCSATGSPAPTYEWYHNNTIIEKSLYRTVKDGVLTIKEARYIDDGIYICIAINKVTSVTISTLLRIKAMAPRFKVPIMDPVFVYEQSTMEVACEILGGPIPTITWSKGNVDVKEVSNRYKVLESGALQITGANEDDIGLYRCKGENSLGTVEQTTTIRLLQPTIITNPPENLTYQVGWKYGMMYCGASHDERLDLRIEWYKNGVLMNKFDSRIYLEARASGPPRILYLHDFRITDAGTYGCHAYTKYGDISSEQWSYGSIRIKGPPEPVAGLRVSGRCSSAFNAIGKLPQLKWIKGEELGVETRRYYIQYATVESALDDKWYGGQGPPVLPGRIIFAEPGTIDYFHLTSEYLVPGANLIFRIRSASDHAIGRASRATKEDACITPQREPVYNSANVTVLFDGPGTLTIWWEPVDEIHYGSDGFYYIVGYKKFEAAGDEYAEINIDPPQNTFTIPSTGVDENYLFYVRSANDKGKGPEPKIFEQRSGTEKPTRAPSDVHIKVVLTYSVEFAWSPMDEATGFRITYWNITDSEDNRGFTPDYFLRKKRDLQAELDGYDMQYQYFFGRDYRNGANLINATADQDFQATVAAVNSGGIGPESEMVEFRTALRIPEQPIKVDLQIFGESAKMTWNPPLHPGGFIEGYVISWYRSDPHDKLPTGKIEQIGLQRRAREAYLVKTFEPMKYYNIRLQARNRMGQGLQWEKQLVAVSANDIPGKPDIPLCKSFDDTSINVTFRNSNYGGLPSKFRVVVRVKDKYYQQQTYYEHDFPKRAWILIRDLDYLIYDIHTVGVNELGQSETSDVVEFRAKKKPKFNAHASATEWWGKYWFIILTQFSLFLVILFATLYLLLRSRNYVTVYKRKKKTRKTLDYPDTRMSAPLIENEENKTEINIKQTITTKTVYEEEEETYRYHGNQTTDAASVSTFGGHNTLSAIQLHNPPSYQSRSLNPSLHSRFTENYVTDNNYPTDNNYTTDNSRYHSRQSVTKKRPSSSSSSSSDGRRSPPSERSSQHSDSDSYDSYTDSKSGKSGESSDEETSKFL